MSNIQVVRKNELNMPLERGMIFVNDQDESVMVVGGDELSSLVFLDTGRAIPIGNFTKVREVLTELRERYQEDWELLHGTVKIDTDP